MLGCLDFVFNAFGIKLYGLWGCGGCRISGYNIKCFGIFNIKGFGVLRFEEWEIKVSNKKMFVLYVWCYAFLVLN